MKKRQVFLWIVVGGLMLCTLFSVISVLSNKALPVKTINPEILSLDDKARILEIDHLRRSLGNDVFPGWGEVDLPMLFYNESFAFLVGYSDPPNGWQRMPGAPLNEADWKIVPQDLIGGEPYYRTSISEDEQLPAFSVLIDDQWVSSIAAKEWMEISLTNEIRTSLPDGLNQMIPYGLITPLFVRGSDGYIALVLHETMHGYQGLRSPAKFVEAENSVSKFETAYPWDDPQIIDAWQQELDTLKDALSERNYQAKVSLVRQFLEIRENRRNSISADLVEYERRREWLEGIAKYSEIAIWRAGSQHKEYEPVNEIVNVLDFSAYQKFDRFWKQELDQISRMASDEGDGRFYYSGMAQAFLLDELDPGWKNRLWETGIWLETLLAGAVQ